MCELYTLIKNEDDNEWGILGDAYQRRSDEIRERISAEFPEFSRMDVLYVRNFIQENGIPLETAISNLRMAPVGFVNRIKYADKLNSTLFYGDKELEVVKNLLKKFDNDKVLDFVRQSLRRNAPLWKVISEEADNFDKETVKYLSAE